MQLTRSELKTLFHVGRKLELVACYLPIKQQEFRTVQAHRSYGYDMARPDGKISTLRFESGNTIDAQSDGTGFQFVSIIDAQGETAAKYRLL